MIWRMLCLAACLLVASCGRGGSDRSAGAPVQPKKPSLEVRVTTSAGEATVEVITDLILSKEHMDGAKRPGEGHIHMYIDNGEKMVTTEKTTTFNNLPPGKHTVNVSLHNNDHTPYDVSRKVEFEIK